MERKWTDRQYHVQYNADVARKDVKMYRNTNKFPELLFSGPHYKPHGARGLSKYYHFRFEPKLRNDVYAIFRLPCAFVACKSMLYKPWMSGIPLKIITLLTCHQVHLLASPIVIKQL